MLDVIQALHTARFQAYLVGGCVRDLLLGIKPRDWDITTNATPEEIVKLFPKTFYENAYGTVGIVNEQTTDETLKVVEVTPYRLESEYSDFRRPDKVTWSDKLEDDLKRRDFTVNAMAYDPTKGQTVDLYKGQSDLAAKVIRTVGPPKDRFSEDALRMLRAVRLSAELGFAIETETEKAIARHAENLGKISAERIRDEFIRLLMSKEPMRAIVKLESLGLLSHFLPELEKSVGVKQNQAHKYEVFEHLLRSLQCAADKNWPQDIRLTALFHDIGKPPTREWSDEKGDWTFHGHEVVGARMTKKILERLRFSKAVAERVVMLVRWHMFFSDVEQISLSAVRRLVAHVGAENIWDLMNVRVCDRVGTGRPKETPYRLRKYKAMIDMVLRDPVSVGMLKIDGTGVMEITKLPAGPKIGHILHALLDLVLDDPKRNTKEFLEGEASKLAKLSDQVLKTYGEQGRTAKEKEEEKELQKILSRHKVQ